MEKIDDYQFHDVHDYEESMKVKEKSYNEKEIADYDVDRAMNVRPPSEPHFEFPLETDVRERDRKNEPIASYGEGSYYKVKDGDMVWSEYTINGKPLKRKNRESDLNIY